MDLVIITVLGQIPALLMTREVALSLSPNLSGFLHNELDELRLLSA